MRLSNCLNDCCHRKNDKTGCFASLLAESAGNWPSSVCVQKQIKQHEDLSYSTNTTPTLGHASDLSEMHSVTINLLCQVCVSAGIDLVLLSTLCRAGHVKHYLNKNLWRRKLCLVSHLAVLCQLRSRLNINQHSFQQPVIVHRKHLTNQQTMQ